MPNDIVLVLDDYHVVDAHDVQDGMAFLLEHLPPQIHLVIASRADPALPLARLRARGELVEIRAADLRFTPDEAAAYLNEVMGLALTAQDVAALEGRTEGWIAALQLAALSMQGRDDVAGFIAGFAGDDRYIVDYLVEEVLQRQPDEVRSFLLETSILDRLTARCAMPSPARTAARRCWRRSIDGNLFLVPLDDRRRWYRYHHLFADVLQAHLLDEQPDRVPELHRRASDWYEQNGDRSEAIRHALAAKDFERAADLIELAIPAMRQGRQEATLRRWLEAIPDELVEVRPVLAVGYVGVTAGQRRSRGRRGAAAPGRAMAGAGAPARGDQRPRRTWSSSTRRSFAVCRARSPCTGPRWPWRAVTWRAPSRMPSGCWMLVGLRTIISSAVAAAGFLGLAYWTSGDLEAAHRWWADAVASLQQAGHVSDVLGCTIALADIRIAQGRLRDAMRTYERGLELAAEQAAPSLRGAPDMHVGISELLRERDDLAAATQHLLLSEELGEPAGLAQNPYRWRVAMARVREAEGDLDAALELLDEAERVYASDYYPERPADPRDEGTGVDRAGTAGRRAGLGA